MVETNGKINKMQGVRLQEIKKGHRLLALVLLTTGLLTGCGRKPDANPTLSLQSPTPIVEPISTPLFMNNGFVQEGETFRGVVERLFGDLYNNPDLWYSDLENYSAVISDPRFGNIVAVDKFAAEVLADLLFGNGLEDQDNIFQAGLIASQTQISVGKSREYQELCRVYGGGNCNVASASRELFLNQGSPDLGGERGEIYHLEIQTPEGRVLLFRLPITYYSDQSRNIYNRPESNGWEVFIEEQWIHVSQLRVIISELQEQENSRGTGKIITLEDGIRELEQRMDLQGLRREDLGLAKISRDNNNLNRSGLNHGLSVDRYSGLRVRGTGALGKKSRGHYF